MRSGLTVLMVALLSACASFAQGAWGTGRPPGFGPEMDKNAIAAFERLRAFLRSDLEYAPGPSVKSGIFVRNFLNRVSLEKVYQTRFKDWLRGLNATPGIANLGIPAGDLPYKMMNLRNEYGSRELGQLPFWDGWSSDAAARSALAQECKKLDDMAAGYIRLLQARLDLETRLGGNIPREQRPTSQSPIYILDVMSEADRAEWTSRAHEKWRQAGQQQPKR
jgi:hypothetical protein